MNKLLNFRNREEFLVSLTEPVRNKMVSLFNDMDNGMSAEVLGIKYIAGCISHLGVDLDKNCNGMGCNVCWAKGCATLKAYFAAPAKAKITVEFHLNGKATTALIKEDGKVIQRGIAKQHVDDKYDAGIGMMWALARALKVEPADLVDIEELVSEQSTGKLVAALHKKWC